MNATQWFIINCKERREQQALEGILRYIWNNYDSDFPAENLKTFQTTIKATNTRNGGTYSIRKNFFPRILLIRFDEIPEWFPGILQSMGDVFSSNKIPLTQDEVDRMDMISEQYRLEEEQKKNLGMRKSDTWIAEGLNVKITHGPFADCTGTISDLLDGNKIRVLIDVFGRDTPIDIDKAYIEYVS